MKPPVDYEAYRLEVDSLRQKNAELRKQIVELKSQMTIAARQAAEELRDTIRSAQDEATWQRTQGDDYGSF